MTKVVRTYFSRIALSFLGCVISFNLFLYFFALPKCRLNTLFSTLALLNKFIHKFFNTPRTPSFLWFNRSNFHQSYLIGNNISKDKTWYLLNICPQKSNLPSQIAGNVLLHLSTNCIIFPSSNTYFIQYKGNWCAPSINKVNVCYSVK